VQMVVTACYIPFVALARCFLSGPSDVNHWPHTGNHPCDWLWCYS